MSIRMVRASKHAAILNPKACHSVHVLGSSCVPVAGLKFGMYSDAGEKTCLGYPGKRLALTGSRKEGFRVRAAKPALLLSRPYQGCLMSECRLATRHLYPGVSPTAVSTGMPCECSEHDAGSSGSRQQQSELPVMLL